MVSVESATLSRNVPSLGDREGILRPHRRAHSAQDVLVIGDLV